MTLDSGALAKLAEKYETWRADDDLYGRIADAVVGSGESLDVFENVPSEKREPVLLFAAVHYLVLAGEGGALSRFYDAPADPRSLDGVGSAFVDFGHENSDILTEIMMERSVQTNEVNRCIGLLPALNIVHRETSRPLALVEVGASAGLNLLFDRYRYDFGSAGVVGQPGAAVRLSTEVRGQRPPVAPALPPVEHRIGVDLAPVPIDDDDAVLWLRACIWAGEVAREQRLTAAIGLARRERPEVRRGDAVGLLSTIAHEAPDDLELVVWSSWVLGWMATDHRGRFAESLRRVAGERPVWLLSLEKDGVVAGVPPISDLPKDASVLGLQRITPEGAEGGVLAVMHHHGGWIDWRDAR